MTDAALRLDKWLVHARFCRTRERAQAAIADGAVRINRAPATKPAATVSPGDVLTLRIGPQVRVIRVRGLGLRRGPASEARLLYEEVSELDN